MTLRKFHGCLFYPDEIHFRIGAGREAARENFMASTDSRRLARAIFLGSKSSLSFEDVLIILSFG